MSLETSKKVLDFFAKTVAKIKQKKVKVTFHGGEPLTAGYDYFDKILSGLKSCSSTVDVEIGIQSNLWLFDDEIGRLFREYNVAVGTSLDGPKEITDAQRGLGYFEKTMQGIQRAHSLGISVGCIATFTQQNFTRWREVFDFFIHEHLDFSIHSAVAGINSNYRYALSPEQYGHLLCEMLDYYIENRKKISVSSLDQICQGVGWLEGRVCTFKECLGMFLAIDPSGNIYNCQRFAGRKEYRLATIHDEFDIEKLFSGQGAQQFLKYQHEVNNACKDCEHFSYCKGGCPYNAWADKQNGKNKDPYCESYKKIFTKIKNRLFEEMSSQENIDAIAEEPYENGHLLLRKGQLIDLIRNGIHPSNVA